MNRSLVRSIYFTAKSRYSQLWVRKYIVAFQPLTRLSIADCVPPWKISHISLSYSCGIFPVGTYPNFQALLRKMAGLNIIEVQADPAHRRPIKQLLRNIPESFGPILWPQAMPDDPGSSTTLRPTFLELENTKSIHLQVEFQFLFPGMFPFFHGYEHSACQNT